MPSELLQVGDLALRWAYVGRLGASPCGSLETLRTRPPWVGAEITPELTVPLVSIESVGEGVMLALERSMKGDLKL
jgi:hypothetical protein